MRSSVLDAATGVRQVSGAIAGDALGAYWAFGEFTWARASAGVYTIRFSRPLRTLAGLSATLASGSSGQINTGNADARGCTVYTFSAAGAPADNAFEFVATGR